MCHIALLTSLPAPMNYMIAAIIRTMMMDRTGHSCHTGLDSLNLVRNEAAAVAA